MVSVTVQSRVDPSLKEKAEIVLSSMGMSTADAIRIFLQQTVNEGRLPFQPHAKIPNAETIEAMEELKNGGGTRYKNTKEMFKDLGIE